MTVQLSNIFLSQSNRGLKPQKKRSKRLPLDPDDILSDALIMDITTKPKETSLLKHAQEKECPVVYGYEMFCEQAADQFELWFNDRISKNAILNHLIEESLQIL